MTECNGCGVCCDPVVLPITQIEALTAPLDPEVRRWVLEDLIPMSRREAKAKFPLVFERPVHQVLNGVATMLQPLFYRCRNYDPETGRCAIYETRPETCRDFPWAGGRPNPGIALPAPCSFNADVGRPVAVTIRPS